ncbi:TIGR01777 family oxidoreductase [Rhodoferax sp.]|uniref:TIGR01777 family oxidoreductase n=1 Tax=Rhodoferax sp. TaxID=50421 RepID=UPI0025F37389|nr:TIGR01777 family oxidoreductase [Rhodoferax sp.]
MPSLHILVTGGTGFLGQALCRMLLAQGHSLTLWVRNLDKGRKMYGQALHCITRLAELQDTPVDAILNFSGEPVLGPRWSPARQQVLHASRSGVTQALVEWVAQLAHKPRWLLSASAIGFYGVQAVDDPGALGEGAPPQPIFMSELCQRWEHTAQGMAAHGVAVATVRLGVVLGQQGALPQMLQPFRFGVGTQMGAGDQVLSWVHLDDVLAAVAFLLAKLDSVPATGAYNLTAPQPVTQREFTRTACKVLHRPLAVPVPAVVLKLLLGEQATLLTDGQRVVPQRLLAEGFRFRFDTFEAALRDLELRRK